MSRYLMRQDRGSNIPISYEQVSLMSEKTRWPSENLIDTSWWCKAEQSSLFNIKHIHALYLVYKKSRYLLTYIMDIGFDRSTLGISRLTCWWCSLHIKFTIIYFLYLVFKEKPFFYQLHWAKCDIQCQGKRVRTKVFEIQWSIFVSA